MSPRSRQLATRALLWLPLLALLALLLLSVWASTVHAGQVLGHPYPLDYGEGPLMAQTGELLSGRSLPALYSDPGQPPYLVINYPPVMLLLSHGTALLLPEQSTPQTTLLAGRLVALGATLAGALALLPLAAAGRRSGPAARLAPLAPLLFLSLSLVREWSVLFRVDMAALAFGLWGLTLALRAPERNAAAAGAGLLFALSLLAKPSFIAAPAAAALWLLLVAPRRALLMGLVAAATGGAVTLLLQLASGGWFLFHVLEANVNRFELELARYFWAEHLELYWPLILAGGAGLIALYLARPETAPRQQRRLWLLPLLYLVFAALSAVGVGKVGAYSNYFLDLDAALVWLACAGLLATAPQAPEQEGRAASLPWLLAPLLVLLLLAQAVRYHPLWDQTQPRSAAKAPRSPRILIGRYPIWRDLQRERQILDGQRRIHQALGREIQAAGQGPLLSDIPGVVVAADATSRLQVFEMRQLLDQGLWRQDRLLQELANGEINLVLLEWLGNWLSPEAITLIRHRYAPDGSLGQLSLYRPVATGPLVKRQTTVSGGPTLSGYHLLQPFDGTYRPAELLSLTLRWRRGELAAAEQWEVALQLSDANGSRISATHAPLLYGALPAEAWPAEQTLQQVLRMELPAVQPGEYQLRLELRQSGNLVLSEKLTSVRIGPQLGQVFNETGYYVPAPFLAAWIDGGGKQTAGLPLTPPIPFEWGWLQCFERACLERRDGVVERRPLGALLGMELGTEDAPALAEPFREFRQAEGRQWELGDPVTPPLRLGPLLVQYLDYARLEVAADDPDGAIQLGRLGAEYMRINDWERFSLP